MSHLALDGSSRCWVVCNTSQLVQQAGAVRDGEEHRALMLLLCSGHGQRPVRESVGSLCSCRHCQHLWPAPVVVLDDRLELPRGDGRVG